MVRAVFLPCCVAVALSAAVPAQQPSQNAEPFRVAGLLQGDDGRPVAGVGVRLTGLSHPELPPTVAWALGAETELCIEGTTDAKGVFRIVLPHRGPFTMVATTPDGQRAGRRFPVMAGDFVTAEVRAPSLVEGRVLSRAGQPVAGARVVESSYSGIGANRERHGGWTPRASATTDDEGRFRLESGNSCPDGVRLTSRSFMAWADGWALKDRWYRIDGQSLSAVELRLEVSTRAAGRIVAAEDGSPIAGASILDPDESRHVVTTDAEGRFTFDAERPAALVVRAPGRAIRGFLAGGDCQLQRGAVVEVRLLGPDGKAGRRRVAMAARDTQGLPFHLAWMTATDAEGRLVIDEARVGEPLYGFVEIGEHFVSFLHLVATAEPIDLGEVRVDGGRTVSGTVLAKDGLRCGGAMVMLQPVFPDGAAVPPWNTATQLPPILTRITYTDRAGRFRFDAVPHARHTCVVAAEFDGVAVRAVEAKGDVGTVQIDEGDTASGIIRLPDGSPAAGARVQYVLTANHGAPTFGLIYLFGRAGEDGRFRVRGLPPHASFSIWGMCVNDAGAFLGSDSRMLEQNDGLEIVLRPHSGRF